VPAKEAPKKEQPKPAPSGEFPPAPPVTVPPTPERPVPAEKEVSYEEALKISASKPREEVGMPPALRPGEPGAPGAAPMTVRTPEEMARSEDEKMLKALSEERRIELEKMKFLSQEYTKKGLEAYAALQYQKAREFAAMALEQDGGNAAARKLYNDARTALGERPGDIASLSEELRDLKRVKMELALEKARAAHDAGRAQMAKGNFEGAADAFDECLTIIQNDAYSISWGDLKSRAEQGLRDARSGISRSQEEAQKRAAADAYRRVKEEELQRQVEAERKYQGLMNDAIGAYENDDFALSESLAGQALAMRPTDGRAASLQEKAGRARHGKTTEELRRKEKEAFRKWKLDMQESMIPYSKVLQGPAGEHWDRITRLRKDLGQVTAGVEESPETAALKNRLSSENTSIQFDGGQTLSDAVTYLNARHNINIYIDEQVKAEADAQPLPPIKLTNLPLKEVLSIVLQNYANLTYRVKGNTVVITKPEFARDTPVIRIHPIGDLTMKINHFIPPNLILKPAGAESDENAPLYGKMEEGQPTYGSGDDLVTLIKDNVGDNPEVWNAEGVGIEANGDATLLVVADPSLQNQVAQFLNDLRKFAGLVVNIESRFLSVTDNFLRDVGVDIRGLGGTKGVTASLDDVTNGLDDGASAGLDNGGVGLPAAASGRPSSGVFFNDGTDGDYRGRTENIFDRSLGTSLSNLGGAILQWTLLDDTQIAAIWRAVEKKQEARVLQSPDLTVYNTQRANITLINQLAFVQDFDVEVAQTAFIADPQIAIIQDGLDLDVKPIVSNDRRYVTLQLQPTIATLKRPLPTFTTSLGAFTTPITLQLPEISIQKAQTTVRVPNGGTLLIGGLKNISTVDLKSETPILSKIPIVSFFFSRRGSSQEFSNLLIVIRARIIDLAQEEQQWAGVGGR
jgi:type II secretory pathway component GspD/PulD (secretin)